MRFKPKLQQHKNEFNVKEYNSIQRKQNEDDKITKNNLNSYKHKKLKINKD